MHPIHLLTFALLGLAAMGVVIAIASLGWTWRRPGSLGPPLLATIALVLVAPLGLLMLFVSFTRGLPQASVSFAIGCGVAMLLAIVNWIVCITRSM